MKHTIPGKNPDIIRRCADALDRRPPPLHIMGVDRTFHRDMSMNEKPQDKKFTNALFSITISEDMELRNQLRSGLMEAQDVDGRKIPLYVSWPSWLKDGVVCMYASDLHTLLKKTVRDAVAAIATQVGEPADIIPGYEETVTTSMDEYLDDTAPKPADTKPAGKPEPAPPEPSAPAEEQPEESAAPSAQDIADELFKDTKADTGAIDDPLGTVDGQDLADFLFKQMKDNK